MAVLHNIGSCIGSLFVFVFSVRGFAILLSFFCRTCSLAMDNSSSANLPKRSCLINDLAYADLSEIFKHLPLYERLIASEVCYRWYALSRMLWLDITKLDLNLIPSKHMAAIVRQCPNLQSAVAVGQAFAPFQLAHLAVASGVLTLKLYNCNFAPPPCCLFSRVLAGRLEHAPLRELIMHDSRGELMLHLSHLGERQGVDGRVPERVFSAACLPTALTHLQLSGEWCRGIVSQQENPLLSGLERLQNLECFILHRPRIPGDFWPAAKDLPACDVRYARIFEKICELKNLKELCLGPGFTYFGPLDLGRLVSALPRLEVLFVDGLRSQENVADLAELISNNSTLRILMLSGCPCGFSVEVPLVRKRFPRGLGSDLLPLLHIFLCGEQNFRFTESSSEAAVSHVIVPPLPQFLARADMAPIFAGVWLAQAIRETAANGGRFWRE